MRIFPTSTVLFQPVRLLFWAMISILGENSNTWTNKIGIIRLYFGSIFPPVRLFQPVRLLILTKFPTSTFIHTSTFIWDFRVLMAYFWGSQFFSISSICCYYIESLQGEFKWYILIIWIPWENKKNNAYFWVWRVFSSFSVQI